MGMTPSRSRSRLSAAAIVLLLVVLGACAKPAVTIEQVRRDTSTASRYLIGQVNPPACGTLPVPAYPELAVRQRPEHVAVRVDLTIDEQGLPTRVRASVVEPVEPTQPFVDASLDAANLTPRLKMKRKPVH